MNIAAYITIRSDYFLFHVPRLMQNGTPLLLLPLHESLLTSPDVPSQERWRLHLEKVFSEKRPDVLWAYNRPDEMTEETARHFRIPVLSQENFGRLPGALPMLFPLTADLDAVARSLNLEEKGCAGGSRTGDPLVITLAFSLSCFDRNETIPAVIERMRSGNNLIPMATYWRESASLASHMSLLMLVVDALKTLDMDWRLQVRVHPRYRERYVRECAWIQQVGWEGVCLDERPVQECLDQTDILICTTSNIGADALRAGCRVITPEQRAFFAHPQLTESPFDAEGLGAALRRAAQDVRVRGRVRSAPLRALEHLAESALATSCDPSCAQDTGRLLAALEEGRGLPALHREGVVS